MKRGITFQIPNKWGSYLGEILRPIDLAEWNWHIGYEESYLLKDDQSQEFLPKEDDEIEGSTLESIIDNKEYYVIFMELKAFPKGEVAQEIETYEGFVRSNCQLVLLIADSSYTTIYCKDKQTLEGLFQNAIDYGFEEVEYITDTNDERTRLSV